jgi:hypothetical protein
VGSSWTHMYRLAGLLRWRSRHLPDENRRTQPICDCERYPYQSIFERASRAFFPRLPCGGEYPAIRFVQSGDVITPSCLVWCRTTLPSCYPWHTNFSRRCTAPYTQTLKIKSASGLQRMMMIEAIRRRQWTLISQRSRHGRKALGSL